MSTLRAGVLSFSFLVSPLAGIAAAQAAGSIGELPFANPEFRGGDYPVKLAHGDLDADGDPDVVVATAGAFDFLGFHTGKSITVHHNLGGGILSELAEGGGALALPTKNGPTAVAVADLDGDLDLDIASADNESGVVTLQRNSGDGHLFQAFSFPCNPDPFALAAGDLDGDGDADLAVTNLGPSFAPLSTVSLLFLGPAGPGAPVAVAVGERPAGVAIADLDLDGDNDLAVGNFQGGSVSIVTNQGGGGFVATGELDSSSGSNEGPSAIAAGDLDGDGLLDLAVTEDGFFPAPQGSLTVFLATGDGEFAPALLHGEGARTDLRLADLDHDGDLEVATATNSGVLSVFVNGGEAELTETSFELGASSGGIDLVDLDSDGELDAVQCDEGTDAVAVARGLGDATFATNARLPLAQVPSGMSLTDVDGDGLSDLLLPGASALEIRRGAGDGTFGEPVIVPLGLTTALHSFALDLDGDGDRDLATLGLNAVVSVRLASGGAFPFESLTAIPEQRTVSMAPGDLDRDGDVDLAVIVQLPSPAVRVLLNHGDATFAVGPVLPFDAGGTGFLFGEFLTESALADLDGDQSLDLVVLPDDGPAGPPPGFPNDRLLVFLGNGDGTLDPATAFPLPVSEAHGLALGDADGDGELDAVVGLPSSATFEGFFTGSTVALLRGNGDGTFQPFEELPSGVGPLAVAIGDFNADGTNDIASANSAFNVTLLAGDGSGGFAPAGAFGGQYGAIELAAADLNGDGRTDLVSAHGSFQSVVVLLAQAGGEDAFTVYGCGVNPEQSLVSLAGAPVIGTTWTLGVDNPLGTQPPGSLAFLGISLAPQPAFPCGPTLPGFGMAGAGALGELLIDLGPLVLSVGPVVWSGASPAPFPLAIPDQPSLAGVHGFAQGAMLDVGGTSGVGVGLTQGGSFELLDD